MDKKALAAFKERTEIEAAIEIREFQAAVRETYTQATALLNDSMGAHTRLQTLTSNSIDRRVRACADSLQTLLLGTITDCAHKTLQFTTPTQVVQQNHSKVNRRLKCSEQQICALKNALQEVKDAEGLDCAHNDCNPCLGKARDFVNEHNLTSSSQLPSPPGHDDLQHTRRGQADGDWQAWRRTANTLLNQLGKKRREVRNDVQAENIRHARQTFQHKFATNQKAANKVINGNLGNAEVAALKDSQG